MIKHIFQIFILLSLASLVLLMGSLSFFYYIWILALPVILFSLVYALYKTHLFYHIKKVLILLFIAISLCTFIPSSGAIAQDLDAQIKQVGESFRAVSRIPADQRTQAQQRQYEQLKKQYEDLIKEKAKEDAQEEKLCKKPQELLQDIQDDCWSCDMAYIIIEGIDKLATTFYNDVQENKYALKLLAIGFAFWLLFAVLKMLGTWGFTDLGAVFTDIFKKFLLVIVAAVLLISPVREVFDLILTPLFSFSAGYTMKMSDVAAFGSSMPKIDEQMSDALNVPPNQCSYCTAMLNPEAAVAQPDGTGNVTAIQLNAEDRAFSPQLKNSMLCIICSLYRTVSPPMIIGQSLSCYATTDGAFTFPPKWVIGAPFRMSIPNLSMWVTGYAIVFTFFIITVLFPFYLIDAFFRIGFVATLLPFLIVAYVFKATRKYTAHAFNVVLYSLFTFLSMSLLLLVLVQMFYAALAEDTEAITNALANNDIVQLFDVFQFASGGLLILMCLVLAYFAFKLISSIDETTGEVSGIHLESQGGIAAISTAAGAIATPVALTSAVYDETWGETGSARAEVMGKGLPTYHSAEAKSRLLRRNTSQRFNAAADKVEHSTDNVATLAEEGLNKTGEAVEKGIKSGGDAAANAVNAAGDALTAKLSAFTAATGGIGGIIAVPLIGVVKATQYSLWAGIKGFSIAAAWATKAATYVTKKATKAAIKLPSKLTAATIRKTGKMIAHNKYFTKTAGATDSIALGIVAGTVLGAAHVGLGLSSLVPGASLGASLSTMGEGIELRSKEDELRVKRARLNELRDKRREAEDKRDSLLSSGTLSAKEQSELNSVETRLSFINAQITQLETEVMNLTQEVTVLKDILKQKEKAKEDAERKKQSEREEKNTPGQAQKDQTSSEKKNTKN